MAKAPAGDMIMAPSKMRPLLAQSKHEPVNVALALSADGEALLLLDRKARPQAVLTMLKAAASKAKIVLNASSLRFGRAVVDPDYDAGTVRLFMNKDAPGVLKMRLTEVIKRIPYQKLEINVDPSLDSEEGASQAADGVPDIAAVRVTFTALVARLGAAASGDAARLAKLKALAGTANECLKADDAEGAAAAVTALQLEVDAAGPAPAGGEAAGSAVRVAKGLLLWNATRSHVDQQLKTLEAAILAQCKGEPNFAEIRENAGSIHAILERLDDSLTDKLNDLRGTTDTGKKLAISQQAKQVLAGYQAYVANDPLIADIDDNGFVPLDIKARVTAALNAVEQVL